MKYTRSAGGPLDAPAEGIRINKYLSEAGICSRREADRWIAEGKVRIDDHTALMGEKVFPGQNIEVDSQPVVLEDELVYLVYNKPAGVVCTTDRKIYRNIVDAVGYPKRVFPVGRLDKLSTGLIFLTNDGDIVNKILRAGNSHEKEYLVTVDKPMEETFIAEMSGGIPILNTITRKCIVKKESDRQFRIILTQGLNRQIRRMCEYLGYNVTSLQRIRIMNISLGNLKPGQWRNMNTKELSVLNRLIRDSKNLPADPGDMDTEE